MDMTSENLPYPKTTPDEPEREIAIARLIVELREKAVHHVCDYELRTGRQRPIKSFVEGEAADEIERLQSALHAAEKRAEEAERERDELSADLLRLRSAVRVRPSKKAMLAVRETLEAMEAMDEKDAAALRLLVEMYDKLEASQ